MMTLYEACFKGSFKKAKFLVEKGEDVNQLNNEGKTPLLAAVSGGYNGEYKRNIIRLLVENGANINFETESGNSCFNWALYRADYETLGEFFKKNVRIPDEYSGRNIIHHFVDSRSNNSIDDRGRRVRIYNLDEVNDRNDRILKLLISEGYDINSKNDEGNTPLNLDNVAGDGNMVHSLLINGADPNICNNDNIYPVYKACMKNSFDSVRHLANSGAELSTTNKFMKSPFQCTSSWRIKAYILFKRIY